MTLFSTLFTNSKDKEEDEEKPARLNLSVILRTFRESILVVGENMRIISVNDAAVSSFARNGEDLIEMRLSEVIRDFALHETFEKVLKKNISLQVRTELIDKDRRIYDVRVTPLNLGKSIQAVGIFYDVTQVEHLERVRQEFLSNISHELRTPLTSILAFVETLEDGAINDDQNNRRFLNVIRKNAERMHFLINDISELSMIESGNVKINVKKVNLHKLVKDVYAILEAKAIERQVSLINSIPKKTIVRADYTRLEQMLINLVDNAVKFNRKDGSITISIEEVDLTDVIKIADTGEGIRREHLQRIFERFYRVDRSRTREIGGTGLGLAIVKHLARLHGGEVKVTSILSEGTTFSISLPK